MIQMQLTRRTGPTIIIASRYITTTASLPSSRHILNRSSRHILNRSSSRSSSRSSNSNISISINSNINSNSSHQHSCTSKSQPNRNFNHNHKDKHHLKHRQVSRTSNLLSARIMDLTAIALLVLQCYLRTPHFYPWLTVTLMSTHVPGL